MFIYPFTTPLAGAGELGEAFSVDTRFVEAIRQAGIDVEPHSAIRVAKNVCNGLDRGESPDQIAHALAEKNKLSAEQASAFMLYAAEAYRRQYVEQS